MLNVSQLIIENMEVESFYDFLKALRRRASEGQILLNFDIKPDYVDTPRDWQWQIETAFYRGEE